MKPELMNDTPPGPIHACHFSGWIQSEIFTQWFPHFIRHTKPTKLYLSTGQALFTHKKPGGHFFISRESCWHHSPPTSQQSQNATLG